MGAVAGGELARAVSSAGGLGMIGPGYHDASWLDREFHLAQGARVGVGFITWDLAKDPGKLAAALAHRPFAVMLSFGDATPFVAAIRDAGARLILQVQTLAAARDAARLAPDLIVAQGTEAGGHGGDHVLVSLLPAVVEALRPLPVAAAGGIADGSGLAAALALGAAGVLIGTRFFATHEALATPEAKRRIVTSSAGSTLRTRIFDIVRRLDWPKEFSGRALRNEFTDRWHGSEPELERQLETEYDRYRAAAAAADPATTVVWAGEGVDLIDAIAPAEAVLARLVREAELALQAASGR
jgi:nitronate monooxygenase